jgi:hypothetical protein
MSNVACTRSRAEARYEVGTVVSTGEDGLEVETDWGTSAAERAASCLVAPAPGDEVALLTTGDGRAWVIAILARAARDGVANDGPRPVEISAEGDLRIAAGGTLSLGSKTFRLQAGEGSVVMSKLTVLASSVLAHSQTMQLAAKTVDGVYERLSQTMKRCFRKVEELDHLRAERADYRTDKELSLRAEHLLATARKLVKVDGSQVHIG